MITRENIQTFRNWNFVLTPVHKSKDPNLDKSPVNKNGKWFYNWTDEELLNANRLGAYHRDSEIFDVDFDDKSFVANSFSSLFPPTLTIGKKVNGRVEPTHLIYRSNGKVKDYKKTQPIVELLANTQTIIAGVDRVIINNVEPLSVDVESIKQHIKLVFSFSELVKVWPMKNLGKRNDAFFKLGGALTQTDIPMDLRLKYVEKLCELTGDREVNNRLSCIERQQEKFDEGKENIWGIKELSETLGKNLPAFDLLKREEKEDETEARGLEFLNGNEFAVKDFPKPEYILWPIVAKQQIRQLFAKAGTGKTLLAMYEAAAVASGYDFLHFKNKDNIKNPVLYVEGEMDSSSIQSRLDDIEVAYEREKKILNKDFIFFATLAIQQDMYFHSLTNQIGRLNVEITAKKIEGITGKKPIIYLDNITALTVMQEKEGAEWVELMQWLSRLRNKGYHVTFLHHPTKTGQTASGSNIKERSIDIDMKLTTPDEDTALEEYEDNFTQMEIEFLKWREHMNTYHSKKRIAVLERGTGKWLIFPSLTKTQRSIWAKLQEGKKPDQIIDPEKKGMSKANVYKTIKLLKREGVIDDEVN